MTFKHLRITCSLGDLPDGGPNWEIRLKSNLLAQFPKSEYSKDDVQRMVDDPPEWLQRAIYAHYEHMKKIERKWHPEHPGNYEWIIEVG